jgi:cell division protein FtsB
VPGRRSRKRVSLFAAALVLVLLFLAGYHLLGMRSRLAAARAEESALAERVARQEQENRTLEAALDRAEDPEYLQQLAREQLGMVTPGQKDFYDVSN